MISETRLADDAREASRSAATEKERLAAINDKERHLLRRDDYGWWMLAMVLYSIADAYVDAHLAGYDAEWTLEASATGPDAARAGVRVAF
jgi:hypothetical protein